MPFPDKSKMVDVAQQVRALDCGSRGRGFESHLPPTKKARFYTGLFYLYLGCTDINMSPLRKKRYNAYGN